MLSEYNLGKMSEELLEFVLIGVFAVAVLLVTGCLTLNEIIGIYVVLLIVMLVGGVIYHQLYKPSEQ